MEVGQVAKRSRDEFLVLESRRRSKAGCARFDPLKLIDSPNLEYKHLTAKVQDAA